MATKAPDCSSAAKENFALAPEEGKKSVDKARSQHECDEKKHCIKAQKD